MFVGYVGNQGLVQLLTVTDDAGLDAISFMSDDGAGNAVVSEILHLLVGITVGRVRCMEKGQAQGVVVGLIPAVFAVVEHRYAVIPVRSRDVGPVLRVDLIGSSGVVAAADVAQSQVIGSFRVAYAPGEGGFQQAFFSAQSISDTTSIRSSEAPSVRLMYCM